MANELYHHGIKGMKWGVRKDHSSSARKSRANKSTDELKTKIDTGKKATQKFLKTNGKAIVKGGVVVGCSMAGIGVVGVLISNLSSLDYSAFNEVAKSSNR